MNTVTAIIALSTAVISGGVAYLIARRSTSGKIDTSDAAVLWAESNAMRKELRNEVVDLRKELISSKRDLLLANAELAKLRDRVSILEKHDDKQ